MATMAAVQDLLKKGRVQVVGSRPKVHFTSRDWDTVAAQVSEDKPEWQKRVSEIRRSDRQCKMVRRRYRDLAAATRQTEPTE
jgi:hypothetical protein